MQISTKVGRGTTIYGVGQHYHLNLSRQFDWHHEALFNQDQFPIPLANLYGSHPFYMGLDGGGKFYGVYLQTDMPVDYQFQPQPNTITMRVMSAENPSLSLFLFAGPSYVDVVRQYTAVVGRSMLPPRWALGYHLCRFGYRTLKQLKEVYTRNRVSHMPQDVQWVDLDYTRDWVPFTLSLAYKELHSFVEDVLHKSHRRFVPIVEPAISATHGGRALQLGKQLDIFVKDRHTGRPISGKVWPGRTYFVDFTHPLAHVYWRRLLLDLQASVAFDGVWLDMNEPASFVDGSTSKCRRNALNNPSYSVTAYRPIYRKTLCMDAVHYGNVSHLAVHNAYGRVQTTVTHRALLHNRHDRRPFLLSRSTTAGSGRVTAHWLGDTVSDWRSLGQSLIAVVEMNMFGVSTTGSDVCGFDGDATEELCVRWHQLGAFYPFMRNHNSDDTVAQDPAVFSKTAQHIIRKALLQRYSLTAQLYTLLYEAHVDGAPVVRPLVAHWPTDANVTNTGDQMLWGEQLMIAPVVQQGARRRVVYFPQGYWYDYTSHMTLVHRSPTLGAHRSIDMPLDSIGVYMRGGSTVVRQPPAQTTHETSGNPLQLLVALDHQGRSEGTLFWDDGELNLIAARHCYWSFNVTRRSSNHVTVRVHRSITGCTAPPLAKITIAGYDGRTPTGITVNDVVQRHVKVKMHSKSARLVVDGLRVILHVQEMIYVDIK